jgi:hypothetical protein
MRQIETELAQLELVLKEKRDLLEKKKQEEEEALSDVQKLAIALHEQKCNSNHMDQCSWGYEGRPDDNTTWHKWTHRRWVDQATKLLKNAGDIDSAYLWLNIHDIVKNL